MNKTTLNYSCQKGIALFQVLLLTAIISVLAIQFTQTAKNQISIASTLADRVQADIDMRTAESQLLFSLLTANRYKHQIEGLPIVEQWNFYGKPFLMGNSVEYNIQDQNSLIGIFRPQNTSILKRGFSTLAVENSETVAASIVDWQDADSLKNLGGAERGDYDSDDMPSNFSFQSYSELAYVNGLSNNTWRELQKFVSIRPQSYINPKLAPKELLALHLPAEQVANIVELRDNNQLTDKYFSNLTGLSADEGMFFSASGLLRIVIKVKVRDVVFTNKFELKVQPYDKHPIIEYEKTT